MIDSSTISLCLTKFLWADFRCTKGGIKLHQSILVHEDRIYPDSAILTQAKKADKTVMEELVVMDPNVLNVFDRGYLTVKHFFGTGANAVYGQIWMALIGYCLLQNLHQTLPQRNTLPNLLRAVQTKLYDAFTDLVAVLSRIPARTSRGRRPNSFSADYAQLLKEIKEYGTDFLNAVSEEMYL